MKDKLTALEAAMLSAYKDGYKWIAVATDNYDIIATKNRNFAWGTWDAIDADKEAFRGLDRHYDISIFSWLTAHGITPPEVE